MEDGLGRATEFVERMIGLDSFRVVELPCQRPDVRLYGCQLLYDLAIGYPPVVVEDKRGVRLLNSKRWPKAWKYAVANGVPIMSCPPGTHHDPSWFAPFLNNPVPTDEQPETAAVDGGDA